MDFNGCVIYCLENQEFVKEFNRLTGHHLLANRTPFEVMIDKACNFNQNEEAMSDFIKFVYDYVWDRLPDDCFE